MADLPLSRLSDDETNLVSRMARESKSQQKVLDHLEKCRDAEQRVQHIGMAVPPELRRFEATINVPGMAVREVVQRQQLRAFVRTGEDERPDPALMEAWEYNNLASQSILCHKDARTCGRAFVSVSSNSEDPEQPLITVEPARGMAVSIDKRTRSIKAALRTYDGDAREKLATLYLPGSTLYLRRASRGWAVDERDDHNFGKVPLVMFLNDPSAGRFEGRSAMADVLPKVEAITRTLLNMQIAAETAAIPGNVIFGASEEDFQDQDGNPIPAWEAYWTKLKAIENEKGHIGQISPADLKNFTHMVDRFLVWCAIELGLPTRYAGMDTTNPASEGAVVADEYRLVKRVENTNLLDGDSWSWVMGLHQEFATGEAPARNSIRALWHNPATPTYSQRVDGVLKLKSAGLVSRRGAWDEMGWSEERKEREMQYMAQEADDPILARFDAMLSNGDQTA